MAYVEIRKARGVHPEGRHELSLCEDGEVHVVAAGSPQAMMAVAKLFKRLDGVQLRIRDIYTYAEAAEREAG